MVTFIHYGHKILNTDLIHPIKNCPNRNKPYGGLWGSNGSSWKNWCLENSYPYCDFSVYFKFKLYKKSNLYIIDSKKDLLSLPMITSGLYTVPDFEKISLSYDAIWLTEKGLYKTDDYNDPCNLYGWDCESILVLNKNKIYQI